MHQDELRKFGGVPERVFGTDPTVPADETNTTWNFGVKPITEPVKDVIRATPSLHSMFPAMAGKWDGKSVFNAWSPAQKVLGDKVEDLIQMQPRGTCGGRAGSLTGDLVQCIMIASGKRAKFHRVSHAAVYYAARKVSGMIGGSWTDENNDGVASGSVPKALASLTGFVGRQEDGDDKWYGDGSDDLACQLAAGMHPELAAKILELGKDNLITAWAPVHSAQELADGIAAGGVGIGSDAQGFTMQRDRYGRCQPRGTWYHYQVRVSIGKYDCGPMFGYAQSWGRGTPSGPALPGHPGNCFGVDFGAQDRIIKSGHWAVVFGFPLFELEKGGGDASWVF